MNRQPSTWVKSEMKRLQQRLKQTGNQKDKEDEKMTILCASGVVERRDLDIVISVVLRFV